MDAHPYIPAKHLCTPMHAYKHLCAPIHAFTYTRFHLNTPSHIHAFIYTPRLHLYTSSPSPINTFTYTHLRLPIHAFTFLYTPSPYTLSPSFLYTPSLIRLSSALISWGNKKPYTLYRCGCYDHNEQHTIKDQLHF